MTSYIYDMVDTWNAGATTFTAVKMNVTDTASASGSLLMDLQVGGSSRFNVGKTGSLKLGVSPTGTNQAGTNVIIAGSQGTGTGAGGSIVFQVAPAGSSGTAQNALATALTIGGDKSVTVTGKFTAIDGTNISPAISGTSSATSGFSFVGANTYVLYASNPISMFGFSKLNLGTSNLSWSSSVGASDDVILARDAANTLALRNGANAQTFRWYRTFTDASNYERGALQTGTNQVIIAAETAGTGADDIDVTLTPAGTGNVRFGTHTGTADTAVSGYIEIKDAGGTIRKLAVIS